MAANNPKVKVAKNGPYVVTGAVPINKAYIVDNADGDPERWEHGPAEPPRETYALCRCGRSRTAPYCDGSHAAGRFDGSETAPPASDRSRREKTEGPALDLTFAPDLCAAARFCRGSGGAWANAERSDDPACRAIALREAADCPSGSLTAYDKADGRPIEPRLEPSISVIEDPPRKQSGPLWVKGGIPVLSAEGVPYEIQNRVTLCRCGGSENKPFCDGTHCRNGFNDGDDRLK
ncbi:MAG: CDGSH iron-sulfur domain-containing protein [Candidatus Aminicenantes bacterium]|nr:CDGSH iron-sulfur domain-containing protein [Candidatus Aminicenantes bacterium]